MLVATPFFRPNVGGVETHLSDYAAALEHKNINASIVTLQPLTDGGSAPKNEKHGSVTIRRYRWIQGPFFHLFETLTILQFLYLFPIMCVVTLLEAFRIGTRRILAVHGHGLAAGMTAVVIARLVGARSIVSIHAIYEVRPRSLKAWFMKVAIGAATEVLCLSDASAKEITNNVRVKRERVHRFQYWIDLEQFRYRDISSARAELGWGMRQATILFVGRLIEKKGVDILCEAMKENPDLRLAVVGDGPAREKLIKAAPPNVEFLGALPNERIPLLMQAADAVVIPSKYEEGYGRVAIEALACGPRVFASAVGGLPEALGSNGTFFEPNVSSLVVALRGAGATFSIDRSQRRERSRAAIGFSEDNADAILRYVNGSGG